MIQEGYNTIMIKGSDVKRVRLARKYTQEEMARKLEVSRPTYIKIEEGERELTVSQAAKIKQILGLDILGAIDANKESIGKYRSMLLAAIHFAGAEGDHRIPKTKLAKLLYLFDAQWFKMHGVTMSGMIYRKLPQGPVPYEFFQSIDQMAQDGTISIKLSGLAQMIGSSERFVEREEISGLRTEELEVIKDICESWKDKRTDAIVNFSHDHPTWSNAVDYGPIDMNELKAYSGPIF
jgi:transcriptional regulator with XRE-family HTH domain